VRDKVEENILSSGYGLDEAFHRLMTTELSCPEEGFSGVATVHAVAVS